eukprot:4944819-Prymnesium_polylepis.1
MPTGPFLVCVFWLIFLPTFYTQIFLPCWDCHDYEVRRAPLLAPPLYDAPRWTILADSGQPVRPVNCAGCDGARDRPRARLQPPGHAPRAQPARDRRHGARRLRGAALS